MVVQKIAEAESLTLLADGWTDIQGNPLMNVMYEAPEPIFLKAVNTKSSHHSVGYIGKNFENRDGKNTSKITVLITDNASNMKLA